MAPVWSAQSTFFLLMKASLPSFFNFILVCYFFMIWKKIQPCDGESVERTAVMELKHSYVFMTTFTALKVSIALMFLFVRA